MAQERLPMHKVREVLRLKAAGLSKRQIAASVGIGPTAAGECLRRAREAGLTWPLPADLDEATLEARLYPPVVVSAERPLPDWAEVHRELRRNAHGHWSMEHRADGQFDGSINVSLCPSYSATRKCRALSGPCPAAGVKA